MKELLERFQITFVQEVKANSRAEIIYKDDDIDYLLAYLPYPDPYDRSKKTNAYYSFLNNELSFFTGEVLRRIKITDPNKYGIIDESVRQYILDWE